MKKPPNVQVRCTCCDALLTVDPATGEVLYTEKPKKSSSFSFDDALTRIQKDKETADDRFKDAFAKEQDRQRLVSQKFETLMEHADELEMPIRDVDLD